MDLSHINLNKFQVSNKNQLWEETKELMYEMQTYYGKVVWSLPYKYSPARIREGFNFAKERGKVGQYGYLIWCIQNV